MTKAQAAETQATEALAQVQAQLDDANKTLKAYSETAVQAELKEKMREDLLKVCVACFACRFSLLTSHCCV